MFCVNLCDIFNLNTNNEDYIEKFLMKIEKMTQNKVERIFLGSYFCDRFFLNFKGYKVLLQFCKAKGIYVTLVIPVFSQNTLNIGKERISKICRSFEGMIDEITVNDLGMLYYVQNFNKYKVNLGRLFFKNPRDCRIPSYTDSTVTPAFISKLNLDFWKKQSINCIELDPTNQILDVSEAKNLDVMIALHSPYCYMTTGKICKFASIHKSINKKFRPNVTCQMECMYISDTYTGHIPQTNCDPMIYRFGRTLFFENDEVKIIGKNQERLIYFPIKEWRTSMYEDISSR